MENLCAACSSLCSSLANIDRLCSPLSSAIHGTIADVQRSARDGCQLCQTLVDPRFCIDELAQVFFSDAMVGGKRLPDESIVRLRGFRDKDGTVETLLFQTGTREPTSPKNPATPPSRVQNPKLQKEKAEDEKRRQDLLASESVATMRALLMALGDDRVVEGRDSAGRKYQLTGQGGLVEVPESPDEAWVTQRRDGMTQDEQDWCTLISLNVRVVTEASHKEPFRLDSVHALEKTNQSVRECVNHHRCAFNATPKFPKRILDVGDDCDSPIRLLETATARELRASGVRKQYITLSYCWGGKQAVTTTRSTLAAHEEGLDLASLPQTIKDAISVTRSLGIKFLWIDALCICQDDPVEKALEIAKMESYYKNSFLTIIAANASRAQDGFLSPLPAAPACEVPYALANGSLSIARLSYNTQDLDQAESDSLLQDEVARAKAKVKTPINTRGWTFQETMLSRKTLRFGIDRIEWRCQEGWAHYSQRVTNTGTHARHGMSLLKTQDVPSFDYFAPAGYKPSLETVIESWNEALEEYTGRYLTMPDDKLPAFSAVAHAYHRVTEDTYLAGIWEERLSLDLLWLMDRPDETLGRGTLQFRRLDVPEIAAGPATRAPSWSWASMDGQIKKYQVYNRLVEYEIDLHSYHVKAKLAEAPFGEVQPGCYLTLDARIKKVPVLEPSENPNHFYATRFPHYEYEDYGLVYFDLGSHETWASCEAWYLWAITVKRIPDGLGGALEGSNEGDDDPEVSGLIITRTGSPDLDEFRRIGMFKEAPRSWFEGTMKPRIRLV